MPTIALAQFHIQTGQPETNLTQARLLAAQAQEAGADILLLPELWLNGCDLGRAEEWAAPLGEGGFARMADLASEFDLHLAGSTLERHGSGVSNTAALYAPDGALLGSYRKVHLFNLMHEDHYLVAGNHATLCPTPWGPVGLAICYDIRFPELFRAMAVAGAVIILIPAQWATRRIEAWLLLVRARAVENELFIAACNRTDSTGEGIFPGGSRIVDPWGNVLAKGGDQEGLVVAQADLREVHRARRYLTVLSDRRPEAYRVSLNPTGGAPTLLAPTPS